MFTRLWFDKTLFKLHDNNNLWCIKANKNPINWSSLPSRAPEVPTTDMAGATNWYRISHLAQSVSTPGHRVAAVTLIRVQEGGKEAKPGWKLASGRQLRPIWLRFRRLTRREVHRWLTWAARGCRVNKVPWMFLIWPLWNTVGAWQGKLCWKRLCDCGALWCVYIYIYILRDGAAAGNGPCLAVFYTLMNPSDSGHYFC